MSRDRVITHGTLVSRSSGGGLHRFLGLTAIAMALAGCSGSAGVEDASGAGQVYTEQQPTADASAGVSFELLGTHDASSVPGLDVPGYLAAANGLLYVPSSGSSEVLVLDREAKIVRRFGSPGTGPGQFSFLRDPTDPDSALGGVSVSGEGAVFVVESAGKRVQRLDASGRGTAVWGSEGTAAGEFLDPIGVATGPAGDVYVVDDQRNDIQVFDDQGVFIRTLGEPGAGPGQLADTGNVRVRDDGLVVNADFGNGRVQAWDAEGAFQWSLGSPGTGPGEFDEPQDVAFGPDGLLFVVDDARVQVFDNRRQLIGTWPDEPSPDHLGSLALIDDMLWVEAPYIDTLFQVRWSLRD